MHVHIYGDTFILLTEARSLSKIHSLWYSGIASVACQPALEMACLCYLRLEL